MRLAQYQCTQCKLIRRLQFEEIIHDYNIQNSLNGLAIYSDIHKCEGGLLGVNNLHVDAHFTMRSLEYLSLPSERQPKDKPLISIPSPQAKKENNELLITNLFPDGTGFRLIFEDEGLGTRINLGEVSEESEPKVSIIKGDLGMITIKVFAADTNFSATLEMWLYKLANLMEILPPPKLGSVIEVLRYIYTKQYEDIEKEYIHLKRIKTVLTTHEIRLKPSYHTDRFDWLAVEGIGKFGNEIAEIMMQLLVDVEMFPDQLLQVYLQKWKQPSIDIISLLIALEEEQFLSLIRPMDHWV